MSGVGFRDVTANLLQVVNVVPLGAVNGINLTYTTPDKFVPGTLEVFLADLKLNGNQTDPERDYDEHPDSQGFTLLLDPAKENRLNCPPQCGEDLLVNYQRKVRC